MGKKNTIQLYDYYSYISLQRFVIINIDPV